MRYMILGGKAILPVLVGNRIAGGNQVPAGWAQNRQHRRLIVILYGRGEGVGRLRSRIEGLLARLLRQGCMGAAKPKYEAETQDRQS